MSMRSERSTRICGEEDAVLFYRTGYLFSGTIGENIALGDDTPDIDRLWYAVRMSCLDDFISGLPMKFDTKIGNTGMGLSGGAKTKIVYCPGRIP